MKENNVIKRWLRNGDLAAFLLYNRFIMIGCL